MIRCTPLLQREMSVRKDEVCEIQNLADGLNYLSLGLRYKHPGKSYADRKQRIVDRR